MTSIPAKLDLTLVSNWITMFQRGQPFFFFFIFFFTVVSEDVVTITLGNRKIRVGNKKETGPATILATKIYNVFDS